MFYSVILLCVFSYDTDTDKSINSDDNNEGDEAIEEGEGEEEAADFEDEEEIDANNVIKRVKNERKADLKNILHEAKLQVFNFYYILILA